MITVTRSFRFDAAHRVLGHGGKCRHLHGHSYLAEVTVAAPALDDLGFVIDFAVLKERVGGWIDREWDHNVLLNRSDPLRDALAREERLPYLMAPGQNPTAENIAAVLAKEAAVLLAPHGLTVVSVTVWETPNCRATYAVPPAHSDTIGEG